MPKEDAPLLERLHSPKDLKGLSLEQCESLCEEIRSLLVVIFWKQRKEVISPKFIKNWFIIMVDLRYLGNLQKELSRCGEAAI